MVLPLEAEKHRSDDSGHLDGCTFVRRAEYSIGAQDPAEACCTRIILMSTRKFFQGPVRHHHTTVPSPCPVTYYLLCI
jgi:hypothetical protein